MLITNLGFKKGLNVLIILVGLQAEHIPVLKLWLLQQCSYRKWDYPAAGVSQSDLLPFSLWWPQLLCPREACWLDSLERNSKKISAIFSLFLWAVTPSTIAFSCIPHSDWKKCSPFIITQGTFRKMHAFGIPSIRSGIWNWGRGKRMRVSAHFLAGHVWNPKFWFVLVIQLCEYLIFLLILIRSPKFANSHTSSCFLGFPGFAMYLCLLSPRPLS